MNIKCLAHRKHPYCYQTKFGSACSCTVKQIFWHCIVVKKSIELIASKENGQLGLKRPELPNGSQGSVFQGQVRRRVLGSRISSHSIFSLVDGEVNRVIFQESAFNLIPMVWGLSACDQHAINFFHLMGGLVSAKQLKDMTQNSILDKELKVLDFVLWLNYHDIVLLGCLPLFLCSLISSIKFALWNLGEA